MKLSFINEKIVSAAMVFSGLTIFTLLGFDFEALTYIAKIICLVMVNVGLRNYFKGKKWRERSLKEKMTILAVIGVIAFVIILVKYYAG